MFFGRALGASAIALLAMLVALCSWAYAQEETDPAGITPSSTQAEEAPDNLNQSVAVEVTPQSDDAALAQNASFDVVMTRPGAMGEITHGLEHRVLLGHPLIESDLNPQQLGDYGKNSFMSICFGESCEYRRQVSFSPDDVHVLDLTQQLYLDNTDRLVMEYNSGFIPSEWTDEQAREFVEVFRQAFEKDYFQNMELIARRGDDGSAWQGFTEVVKDHNGYSAIMNVHGRMIEYIFLSDTRVVEWLSHPDPGPPIEPDSEHGLGLLLLPKH